MATPQLLRKGNSDLARDGIFTWSIPALLSWSEVLGSNVMTCKNAGACAALCYARQGRYRFGTVLAAHQRNLDTYLADPSEWVARMKKELQARRFNPSATPHAFDWPMRPDFAAWAESGGRAVRIHDAGDFFSEQYLLDWSVLAWASPHVLFYAYTKEVEMAKRLQNAKDLMPKNLVFIYSMGGKQDHLIDREHDRHCDVFPSLEALEAAGYTDQASSDLMAPLLDGHRLGIVANRLPSLRKRQGDRSFSAIQEQIPSRAES